MNILLSSLLFFFLPNWVLSQDTLHISFGEQIEIGKLGEKYNYRLTYLNSSKTLSYSELNSYIFEKPGIYEVFPQEIITEKYFGKRVNSEEVLLLPTKFLVNVDSIRMVFQPQSIRVDKPLKQNISLEGAILSVDCEIKNYFNTPILFENKRLKIAAAGIGAAVKGELNHLHTRMPGIHTLAYRLFGMFHEKAHIQFDFELYNGKIFPIGYHEAIK